MSVQVGQSYDFNGLAIIDFAMNPSAVAPSTPVDAMPWWESDQQLLKIYDGTNTKWDMVVLAPDSVTDENIPVFDGTSGGRIKDSGVSLASLTSGLEYKGGYDASTNTPDLDSSPSGVSVGDVYTVTGAGDFFTEAVQVGDMLIAEADGASTLAEWTIVEKNVPGDFTFSNLEDTPNAYTGSANYMVMVNSSPDALEFVDPSGYGLSNFDDDLTTIVGNTTNAAVQSPGAGQDGYAIVWDNSAGEYTLDTFASGSTSFLGLTDTPADYTGDAGKLIRVNATPDALEFVTLATLMSNLTDTANGGLADFSYNGTAAVDIALDFTNLTNETALANADEFAYYDASASAMRALTYSALKTALNSDLDFTTTLALDDLSDVSISSASTGHLTVYTGSGWENKKFRHTEELTTSASVYTITHNLNTRRIFVVVQDTNGQEIKVEWKCNASNPGTQVDITFGNAPTANTRIVTVYGLDFGETEDDNYPS